MGADRKWQAGNELEPIPARHDLKRQNG